jgi:HTH-type transcriptional regulator/antitoxin HigA
MKDKWKKLETEEEYDLALERTIALFNTPSGTAESDELEHLIKLVVEYEDLHYPMPDIDKSK